MATLIAGLTLTSADSHLDPLRLSDYGELGVEVPSTGLSRISTAANPFGDGAGVLIPDTVAEQIYVYIKHTGLEAADGTTACAATDYFDITDADGTATGIQMRLYPGEFTFFSLTEGDGASSQGSGNDGGLKVAKYGSGSEVMIEYAYWTRS